MEVEKIDTFFEIVVNGNTERLQNTTTIKQYLAKVGIPLQNCVAELNGEIVPLNDFSTVQLRQGDCLELVRFVGGG